MAGPALPQEGQQATHHVPVAQPKTAAASAAEADRAGNGSGAHGGGTNGSYASGGTEPADPWFSPGPKVRAAAEPPTTEWFLPAGRAGLLPESITESWEADAPDRPEQTWRVASAGAPPWAGEPTRTPPADGEPPPWETGPWPGPGEQRAVTPPPRAALGATAGHSAGGHSADGHSADGHSTGALGSRLAALPLPPRLLLAFGGALLAIVVIVIVVIATTTGSPAGACGTYPAAVRQAYAKVMSDLHGGVPASAQAADLGQAASQANAAAASAGQIAVRNALFGMAGDLEQARADVTAGQVVPASLVQRLTADGTALPASC